MWQPVTDIQDIRQPTEEDKGEGSPFISEEAFDWLDLFIDGCDKGCCNPEALKFIPLDKAVAAVQLTLPAFEHTPTVKGTGVKASRWTRSKVNSGKHTLETEDSSSKRARAETMAHGCWLVLSVLSLQTVLTSRRPDGGLRVAHMPHANSK